MPTVLIIDDEEMVRRATRRFVQMLFEGWQVIEASGGEEGIRMFSEQPVDIVITDLKMPHVSGHDVIRTIRETNKEVKILAQSGNLPEGGVEGADACLEKPMLLEDFERTLRSLVQE